MAELMPFLQLTSIQTAVIHLSKPIGESSKMRAHLDGELFLAGIAVPDATGLNERVLLRVATGTIEPCRQASGV